MNESMANIKVEVKEGTEILKIIHEPIQERRLHQWNPRKYELESLQAIVDLIKTKGSVENTVIFYSTSDIRIILDDSIENRPQDKASYPFQKSEELKNWQSILGHRLSQKDLIDFLKRLDNEEVHDREMLIANIRKLQVMTEIKGDYQYDEDGNVSVMYKETSGKEGIMALPKYVFINIPILNECSYIPMLELELELIKPKAEGERPAIVLTCPKLKKHVDDAVKHEVSELKKQLPTYLILAGRD